MDWIYTIKVVTLILCWVNYLLNLREHKWNFGEMSNIGWLMAVLGWTNAVLQMDCYYCNTKLKESDEGQDYVDFIESGSGIMTNLSCLECNSTVMVWTPEMGEG